MDVKYDERGLVPAVIQDRLTGEVRMVGWMSEPAVERTLTTGKVTFYSRSRDRLWEKGESSGHALLVQAVWRDCDSDTLLVQVDPQGPTCHTGARSCFFEPLPGSADPGEAPAALPLIDRLEAVIAARAEAGDSQSYTARLLGGGSQRIGEKLREEAEELSRAIDSESEARVASEAADVLYHLLVGLRHRGVAWRDVLDTLAGRFGKSGIAEKAARR